MNDIQQELKALDWTLPPSNKAVQEVPEGYFDSVNDNIFDIIKAEAFVESLAKEMPQSAPIGYFDNFNEQVLSQLETEPTMTIHKQSKLKPWALAASIALILSVGMFMFQATERLSVNAELAQISDTELQEYMQDNDYEFNDYIIEGKTANIKQVEEDFFEAAEGLTKDELLEYAL